MKKQFINIAYFTIFLFIWIWLLFYLNSKNLDNNKMNPISNYGLHNGIEISKILSKENYDKIWIDPNKYSTFSWFLNDFKSFSWVKIDPINENFSIAIEQGSWWTLYIPFRFLKNKENFDDKINKNLAILDIYSAYKNWKIYGWANSSYGTKIIFEDEVQHPESSDLKQIFWKSLNINKVISELETHELSKSKKELLSYLYDFTWDYKKANENRKKLCEESKDCKEIILKVSWKILDQNSKPVVWAKVELLNDDNFYTISWKDGIFNMDIKYSVFSHIRFKASINWYSDWFNTYSINDYFLDLKSKPIIANFTLNKANNIISINNSTISKYKKDKYYIIEDEHSKYMVPTDWLYYEDDTKYEKGNFDVYLYFFKKTDNANNLLNNDTFSPVVWYVWNLMKTFWMPYIQFVDKETKKELFVKSSNPMILQNHIYHMKELYENHDKIYTAITKEDMKYLVKISKEKWWYPIDYNFLTTNNFLKWPAWWALDRKTWVWWNIWMKVINEDWLVELPFYSIKDN